MNNQSKASKSGWIRTWTANPFIADYHRTDHLEYKKILSTW